MNCNKSICVATEGAQNVAIGSNVIFNRIVRRDGNGIGLEGNQLAIKECGQQYYLVTFNCSLSAATAGNIIMSMTVNGNTIVGSTKTQTIVTPDTEFQVVSITCLVKTPCCPQINTVSVNIDGIAAIVNNATLTAVKVSR